MSLDSQKYSYQDTSGKNNAPLSYQERGWGGVEIGKGIGLIIGRFQPFHRGHELLVNTSLKHHPATLILIGSSQKVDTNNPYSAELRKHILTENYPDSQLSLGLLPDMEDDAAWVEMICSYIPEIVTDITLYCGDKNHDSAIITLESFQKTLPFTLHIHEIPRSQIPVSATQVRDWLENNQEDLLEKYLSDITRNILKN